MAVITATTRVARVIVATTLVLILACCYTASAQTPAPESAAAPAPGTGSNDCLMALANMSDCLTYVTDGSKLSKPNEGCCPELAGLVDSNPICLCELLGRPDSIGIKIDLNKALKLPSVCGVSTPPVSTCSAVGVPVSLPPSISEGSPSIAPGATSPSNPVSAPSSLGPSSSAGDAAASPSENKNGVSSIEASTLTNFIFGLSTLIVSVFF